MRKWKSADIRNIAASATATAAAARVTVYFRSQMMCLCNTFSRRRRRRRWLGSSALRRAKTTTTMMMSQMPSTWCDIVWEASGHKMLGSCDKLQLRIEMFVCYHTAWCLLSSCSAKIVSFSAPEKAAATKKANVSCDLYFSREKISTTFVTKNLTVY